MGKKARSKARNQHKMRSRPSTLSKKVNPEVEVNEDGVHDGGDCEHYDKKDADLNLILLKIRSLEWKCEDCRVDSSHSRRGNKGKAKGGRKKGGSGSVDSETLWVCLSCGYLGCGGVSVSTPCGHSRRHSKKDHHLLAARLDHPVSGWCFQCNSNIRIEMPDGPEMEPKSTSEVVNRLSSGDDMGNCKKEDDVGDNLPADVRKSYVVRGLVNLGNTCFFNSVMQNLFATEMLREYFLSMTDMRGPLTMALKKLFNETSAGLGSNKGSINPKNVFGCICSKAPHFKGYEQQDSHELLRYLLDGLCVEELTARKLHGTLDKNEGTLHGVPTFVDVVFGGQLSSTVCCVECGHSSVVHEPFLDLSLPVPSKKMPSKKLSAAPVKKSKSLPSDVPKGRRTREKGSVKISNLDQWKRDPVDESFRSMKQNKIQSAGSPESGESYFSSANEKQRMPLNEENVLFWLDYVEPTVTAKIVHPISDKIEKPASVLNDHENWKTCQIKSGVSVPEMVIHECSKSHAIVTQEFSGAALHMQVQDIGAQSSGGITEIQGQVQDAEVESSGETNEVPMKFQDIAGSSRETNEIPLPVPHEKVGYSEERNRVLSKVQDNAGSSGETKEVPLQIQDPEVGSPEQTNEVPLQVQDAEVILLPYMELTSIAKGTPEAGVEIKKSEDYDGANANLVHKSGNTVSTSVACEPAEVEFEGLGDLFAEPEITSDIRPGKVNLEDAEASCLPGNNSESNQEEVDNTNAPVSVVSCLAYFTKPELLSGEHAWHCENCSRKLQDQNTKICKSNQQEIQCDKLHEGLHPAVDAPKFIDNTVTFPLEGNLVSCSENATLQNGSLTNSVGNVVYDGTICKSKETSKKISVQSDSSEKEIDQCCVVSEKDEKFVGSDTSQYFSCASNVEKTSFNMNSYVSGSNSCSKDELNDDACEVQSLSLATSPQSVADIREENGSDTSVDFQKMKENGKRMANKHSKNEAGHSERLKAKRDATKRILINKAPHILTIHLKRFSQDARGRLSKLNGYVNFQEVLDLAPYMDPRSHGNDKHVFRLIGVVEHSGTLRGGHYIAYVRGVKASRDGNNTSAWFYISDVHVREAPLTEVLQCEAYILFYERIHH